MGGIKKVKIDDSEGNLKKYWTLGTKESILAYQSGYIGLPATVILSKDKKVMEELQKREDLKLLNVVNYDDVPPIYWKSIAYVVSSVEEYDKI